ncbi:MAG: nucleotidyltransferase domain-containing protein [gamma proteobacterium symbiont of Taylorina sp.]|nr:nucleotidyltransferase domain-containing protein [gamma proteobacterium symbiont of Taylorina sp.]
MSLLGDALFTLTQQRVLGLLYVQPQKSFYTKEILRLTGMGVATIKRELDRMVAASILTFKKIGNQHHYQANPDCPIYQELLSTVKKTFGIADTIKLALNPISKQIFRSFIFGSVASGKETANSDIDLMIIGDCKFSEVVGLLYNSQELLGREINPKIYSKQEWDELCLSNTSFIKEVLDKPKIDVIGNSHELR